VSGKLRIEPCPVDFGLAIGEAVEAVRPAVEAKGIRLETTLDPAVGPVLGDPDRLQQVVWNLISNATKFTPSGGRIEVGLARSDGHVELRVSDTGEGIRSEFLPYVFDRFRQGDSTSTRTHGGLGLGLAIVRHLIELHGGTIAAASEGPGHGATFTVRLPITTRTVAAPTKPKDANGADNEALSRLDGLRVLLVDDEQEQRESFCATLEEYGANVTTAASASEALTVLTRIRPDILVSDIVMPGDDGYALMRKVRALTWERGGKTPAVALTAYGRAEDRQRAIDAGYQAQLVKTSAPTELAGMVGKLARWSYKT
jgi:CheY-like chemotaxis protein